MVPTHISMGGMKCQSAGSACCAAAQGAPAISAHPQRVGLASWTKRCDGCNVNIPRNWEVQVFIELLCRAGCRLSPGSPGRAAWKAPRCPRQASLLVGCKCWFKKCLKESIKASYEFTGYFGNCHIPPVNRSCRFMFYSAFAFKTRQATT